MKSTIAVAAVAGLAAAASAQTGSVSLVASQTIASAGDIITISVVVDDDGTTPGVFSFDVQVTSGDAGFSVVGGSLAPNGAVFGWAGAELANGATGLGGSTDILGPTFDAPLNGLAVYSFQIQYNGGEVTLTSSDGAGPNAALQTVTEGGLVLAPAQYASIDFGSVRITPAPSGLALLGLGGLIAGRRRR